MGLNYWSPIENLPENWEGLKSVDIPPLARVWSDQADKLKKSTAYITVVTPVDWTQG